jgi:hypothetical protein
MSISLTRALFFTATALLALVQVQTSVSAQFVKPPYAKPPKHSAFMNMDAAVGRRAFTQNRVIVKFKFGTSAVGSEQVVRDAIRNNAASSSSGSGGAGNTGGVRKIINLPRLGMAVVVLDSFQTMEAAVGALGAVGEIETAVLDAPVVAYDKMGNLRGGMKNGFDNVDTFSDIFKSHERNLNL